MSDDRSTVERTTEWMLLGAMMMSDADCDRALTALRADAMVSPQRTLLDLLRGLREKGESAAFPLVIERLQATGGLEQLGGREWITDLAMGQCPSASVVPIAEAINRATLRREIKTAGTEITHEADNPPDVDEALDFAERRVLSLRVASASDPVAMFVAPDPSSIPPPIPTGFRHLDSLLSGGFRAGELIVLGGRPGMGKTSLGIRLGDNIARNGQRVLYASYEMTAQEIRARGQALHGATLYESRHGRPAPRLATDGLVYDIVTPHHASLGELQAVILRTRPDFVVVDYLQLLRGKGERRHEQMDFVARGLKSLAMRFKIPVLVLAALNRSTAEGGKLRPPVLSDLRESGEIEYAADIVLMIHRPDFKSDAAELWLRKQRNGPQGEIALRFIREHATFVEKPDAATD